ncbi:CRISPR-associated endonuclease Cas2 [Butyrivibrio hungatei]|uniref:CRISPR-associated protein Cas2 n=1 Tax=Butyrivibrio hungatei TaxID=185008 RepID=A0A1D9P6W9_9FIRM|nr:CRISPR-associated endonuclease Cas2 [Butyrivibrio hungatei]AOZ97885.1 CRISPR-associated protein Cas2 [Butyrivibrio hungatei]
MAISNNKKRAKFAKYLEQYGHRIQYSVFEITNSSRLLNNIMNDIENKFMKKFDQSDSVYIFNLSPSCKVTKYGYAKNEDSDIMIIS